MTNTMDRNDLASVVNSQQDAVVAHAEPVGISTCQLFDVGTPRFAGQQANALKDQLPKRFWDRAEIFFDPPIVADLVHGLDELFPFEAGEELVVRNGAAAGTNGLFERFRIGQILNEMDQFSVIDQREDDRSGSSPLIDEKSLWFQERSHGNCESSMRCCECQRG